MNIDYLPAEYCLDTDFNFLFPNTDDWSTDTIVLQAHSMNIYTDASKLYNVFGSGVYSGRLDLNISLRLSDYCSVFQAVVMVIYQAAQWMLISCASLIRVSVVPDRQVAIRSLSGSMNNSRFVRECCRCIDFLSGRFTSVSLQLK